MLSYARVAAGLSALHPNKSLRASAGDKARDVLRCQSFSHEACGRSFTYWIRRVGFFRGGREVGEMLAFGGGQSGSVRATVTNWLNSPEHRNVLLQRAFDLVGVGTVIGTFRGVRGTRIWVAHLGGRRAAVRPG